MTTGSLRVPATGALADLLACPPPLLDVTLDQLRTLLTVRETGSPLAAARILGREHSSLPGGSGIRVVPLTTDYDPPLQLLAGIFARKGERELYDTAHPLNLLWNAFDAHVRDGRGGAYGQT